MSIDIAGRSLRAGGVNARGMAVPVIAVAYAAAFVVITKPASLLLDMGWGSAAFAWMLLAAVVVTIFRRKLPNEAKITQFALISGAAMFGLAFHSQQPAKWLVLLCLALLVGLPTTFGIETRVERRQRLLDAVPALPAPVAPHWRLSTGPRWEYHEGNWVYAFDVAKGDTGWGWEWRGAGPAPNPPTHIPPNPGVMAQA